MKIELGSALNISEVSIDFSKATRTAQRDGFAVILKYGKPRFILVDAQRLDKIKELAPELAAE